jgi:glycogen debranching enzyme
LGQLAEVYDGDAPQREGGTPAQAWSVAEVLWLLSKELAF